MGTLNTFSLQDLTRLRRILQDYEAGNLTNGVTSPAARQQRVFLNVYKIASVGTGGGKYNLTLVQPSDGGSDDDVDDTSDLNGADFGKEYDAPDNVSYLGVYPPEVGTSDHALSIGQYYVAMTRRQQTGDDSSGTKIVAIILGGGGSLPKPQYQWMVAQGVSQNQFGYTFVHATPMMD